MRKILGVGVDEAVKPLIAALTLGALALWYVRRRERQLVDRISNGRRF